MFLNPYTADIRNINDYSETKINEVIEELIKRNPNILYENEYEVRKEIENLINERNIKIPLENILESLTGYGKIRYLIDDENITDIWANNHKEVYIKKFGKKEKTKISFKSEKEYTEFCRRLVYINGETINENTALVTCTDRKKMLRVVVGINPISIKPFFVIRKPATGQLLEELMEQGVITQKQIDFLRNAVQERKTIIIAGKGGSGKTTLLGSLIREIPDNERFLLIQESLEIKPEHKDCVIELVRTSESQYVKNYTLFDLTKAGLLMSLDRMIIGEIKDREAYDFFNAIFTGHAGSMATIHTTNAESVIPRLILLMKRANTDLTEEYLRNLLLMSLDYVVYMKDYKLENIYDVKKGCEV